ncbi:MAG: OmpH family outer membrane protein [Bacteroidota bacterium]|nr:OmpH family outer membrane protein [Bacteroidota bacterium]
MNKKIIGTYIVLSFTGICILTYFQIINNKKIGYVTTLKVFEEFKEKKELETKYQKIQIVKQTYLDSLKLNIQSLENGDFKKNEEKINELKKIYLLKENQFNQENEVLYKDYTDQIWKQLNQYIEDYGKEKKYDFLLGATGQGNIMYASDKEDLTKEIIEYVNNKYDGKINK